MLGAHPKALYLLFATEMWERFSYYGMRALLMLYMLEVLHDDIHHAGMIYGLYTGLVYLTPLLGGYLADHYLGQQKSVMIGGLLMMLGHFLMGFAVHWVFYLALGMIVCGNGLFKPNISVLVGRLYALNDPKRDSAFSIFYMGINIGAFFSPLICGTLGQKMGWHWGFSAAGVGMLISLIVYHWGQKFLPQYKQYQLETIHPIASTLNRKDWHRIWAIAMLALFGNVIFWAAFEQAGSSMTLFANSATRLYIAIFDITIPSSWLLSANPFFIIILSPLFTALWNFLRTHHAEPSIPIKFILGMLLVSAGFGMLALAGHFYDSTGIPVNMLWLVMTYALHTCGELCVSPVGLSAVTKLAPPRYTSLLMGFWFASISAANYLGGLFASEYNDVNKATFFLIPTVMTAAGAVLLIVMVKPMKYLMHQS